MDWNQLHVFVRVVEAGSFTAAGRRLGIPKSTVSARVAQLEEHLGVRLLQRTTRRVALTDAGRDFYARCARIVGDVEEAERSVTEQQLTPRGTLRVTAPVELGSTYLGAIAAAYCARYPEVKLDVVTTDRMVDLVDEGFDLGIRLGQLPPSALIARKLAAITSQLYASPAYLEARGRPATPEELAGHACIVFSSPRQADVWRLQHDDGARAEVRVSGPLAINSLRAVYDAAVAGLGIAMLPLFAATTQLDTSSLCRVLPDWRGPEAGMHVVYPSGRHLSVKTRSFVDFLTECPDTWVGIA